MNRTSRRTLLRKGLVVLVAAVALAGCGSAPAPTPTTASLIPLPEVPRISVAEAAAHLAAGTALFVDVRSAEAYAEGHIPDSVNLPMANLESDYASLPKARLIITICT